jgi:3D (Asp-Asp-Asp) domain-containing protein
MKAYLAAGLATLLLASCESYNQSHKTKKLARVTFYNKHEDKYGSRIAASTTRRARVAETVAAEACCFPFGKRICIPDLSGIVGDGIFTVEDRGSAVNKRVASRGKYPVFDIYAGTRKQMRQWANQVPPYLPYYEL